jgi:GTP cyclohydrolase IA
MTIVDRNSFNSSSTPANSDIIEIERIAAKPTTAKIGRSDMADAVRTLILGVAEDPDREGLLKTPDRVAKAMQFLTSGYHQSLAELINGAVFDEGHNEMVLVRDIDLFSLCEHHMLPFVGRAHIAYIPNQKVVGAFQEDPKTREEFLSLIRHKPAFW